MLCKNVILFLSLCLRFSSTSPLATRPCPSTSTVTSPTGCTTPSSATPSPLSSSSATSTTRPTAASSPGVTPPPPPPPKQERPSLMGPSTGSARLPTERCWRGAKRRNPRRTLGGERGKEELKEIRGRRVGEVEVRYGLALGSRLLVLKHERLGWMCYGVMCLFKPWSECCR